MTGIGVRVVVLVACIVASGCTTYNPATGQYQPDPVGTSLLAGGLGMAGGVALGAALSDHDDCCWGGGYNSNVYVHNNYNRTVNYNQNTNYNRQNTNYNRNVNRGNAGKWSGGGGRGGWGGGGRGGGRRRR
ncbi:MAG TPA: hypothetical protein VJ829_14775 [Candidatus Binatia bacterium]|jgi:hypothetical protein|nr:hypothetical protein [Candidatus Binatia bacterium]